jgi:phosphoglycolate phosphatase
LNAQAFEALALSRIFGAATPTVMTQNSDHPLTVVFDLDGTLVDTAPDLVAAANHVLAHVGAEPVTVEQLKVWVGSGARRMIVEGLNHRGLSLDEPAVDELFERFLTFYEANIAIDSRPFDGARETLQKLRNNNVRLAICTNKREALSRMLLDALDLTSYFDAIAGRDTFPVYKPDPGHLLGTIQMANGTPTRAVMIGDSQTDIETAKQAQIPVIAVTHGYTLQPVETYQPDQVIDHFADLETALNALKLKM